MDVQVLGHLEKDKERLPSPTISGKWDEGLWAVKEDGSRVELWRVNPPPPDPTRYGIYDLSDITKSQGRLSTA